MGVAHDPLVGKAQLFDHTLALEGSLADELYNDAEKKREEDDEAEE